VRSCNRSDKRLDALVLTQDDRALRPAGNKDAVKVGGIDCVDGTIHVVGADLLEVAVDLHGSLRRGHHIDARAKQLEREPRDEALFFLKAIRDQRGNARWLGHRSLLWHSLMPTAPEVMRKTVASPARIWPCPQIVV